MGHFLYFNQVLLANPRLEPLLKTGDKVILPSIKIKESKEKGFMVRKPKFKLIAKGEDIHRKTF